MAQTTFSIRMDSDVKKNLDDFCSQVGMNTTTAFNLFARAVLREKRLPFDITTDITPTHRIPNTEFQAAIDECDAILRGELPPPPTLSTAQFIESMKEWVDDEI
ncbi:MAG: type II toxin-antitoxin system RelB/DinJ family antitoxin [Defluviitaleaceae bacterium]|nr:type II toxin-antitoxin system RelB/DinJ family antitoxin [Defluviitaleaceae bacterium]MCL2239525.1 type II toxin-antitoxin system RelB/DinJ family antitoxin [Defluviitaleaceae bacterium]